MVLLSKVDILFDFSTMNCVLFTLIFVVSTTVRAERARNAVSNEEKQAMYTINELLEDFLDELEFNQKIDVARLNDILDKIVQKSTSKLGSLLNPVLSLVGVLKKTVAEAVNAPREKVIQMVAKIRSLHREIKEGVELIPDFPPLGALTDIELHIPDFVVTTKNRLLRWGKSLLNGG